LESGTAFLHLNSDNRSILSTGKEEVSVYSFVENILVAYTSSTCLNLMKRIQRMLIH